MFALRRAGYAGIAARDRDPWSPRRSRRVILTFDDGYADLARFALPVLVDLGFHATVFVVADAVGGSNMWDAPAGAGGHRIMDEDDQHAWSAAGCEVGSHGMAHVDLTSLGSKELDAEINGSHQALSTLAGAPITSFAYPYGAHNARVRQATMGTYLRAFGIDEGRNDATTDPSQLRRSMVQPADTAIDVLLRARLGWSGLERARTIARPRSRARAAAAQFRRRVARQD
jgi:peptidoglycan/xylan/chitin deacetylase (PgdA/CDA1 family)